MDGQIFSFYYVLVVHCFLFLLLKIFEFLFFLEICQISSRPVFVATGCATVARLTHVSSPMHEEGLVRTAQA